MARSFKAGVCGIHLFEQAPACCKQATACSKLAFTILKVPLLEILKFCCIKSTWEIYVASKNRPPVLKRVPTTSLAKTSSVLKQALVYFEISTHLFRNKRPPILNNSPLASFMRQPV